MEHRKRYLGHCEVALSAANTPTWLAMLDKHANLLTNKPCEPYAADLLQGDRKTLEIAAEGIGISRTSWLWQEAMITTVKTATEVDSDSTFACGSIRCSTCSSANRIAN